MAWPCAPGNVRAAATHKGYAELVRRWAAERRTLRYSGAMVPDVYQLLCRGGGVFANVTAPGATPKLRALFEVRGCTAGEGAPCDGMVVGRR